MHRPFLAAVASLVALAGCAADQHRRAPAPAVIDPVHASEYPQIIVHEELRNWIAAQRPVVTRGDVMRVMVPVRLLSNQGQNAFVQYRFVFTDERGTPLRTQSDWKFINLEPRIPVELTGTALDSTAAEWRLEIRPAR